MAEYRATLFFSFAGPPSTGFTEAYDFSASDNSDGMTKAQNIANGRKVFLSRSWTIDNIKLSKLTTRVNKAGKCALKVTEQAICLTWTASAGGFPDDADTPASAVFAKSFFTDKPRAVNRQYRGIPDALWSGATLNVVQPYFDAFALVLKSQGHKFFQPGGTPPTCSAPTQFALDCIKVQRISSRRVGRPFKLLRGRRAKKKETP